MLEDSVQECRRAVIVLLRMQAKRPRTVNDLRDGWYGNRVMRGEFSCALVVPGELVMSHNAVDFKMVALGVKTMKGGGGQRQV